MKGSSGKYVNRLMSQLLQGSATVKGTLVKHVKVVLGTFLVALALTGLACGTVATPVIVEKEVPVEKRFEVVVTATPEAPASTLVVTDIAGRSVTVKYPVERVILGEGRQTYITAALEPEAPFRRIVGWRDDLKKADLDTYNKYKEKFPEVEDIPLFGRPGRGDFSAEQAIALDPDVLILNLGSLQGAKESGLIDELAAAGIPVVVIDFRQKPLENTVPSIILMGRLWGKEERAQQIVDYYLQQVNLVYNRLAKIDKPKPTVFLDRAPGAGFFACCATFGRANLGLLVERAGGEHLGSKWIPGWAGQVNPEQILVSDPDVIIATGANWVHYNPDGNFVSLGYGSTVEKARSALRGLAKRAGWAQLQAVKDGKFHGIWHQFYNSPYHFVALQQFAKWFYPEEFKDMDPTANFKEFHDRFLPIDYSGTFWASLEQ